MNIVMELKFCDRTNYSLYFHCCIITPGGDITTEVQTNFVFSQNFTMVPLVVNSDNN